MSSIEFKTKTPNPDINKAYDVDPEEVLSLKDELFLVDVRQPEEYTGELGHIPGSTLITLDDLPEKVSTLPKDKTIVFICRSGARSGRATGFAIDNGFSEVYNMKGGMIAWNQKEFVTEGKPA